MSDDERLALIEELADAEHASWARWMDYLFSKCERRDDGAFVIPSSLAFHWLRQVETPYDRLTEREKESDRKEVAQILPTIDSYLLARIAELESALDRAVYGLVPQIKRGETRQCLVCGKQSVADEPWEALHSGCPVTRMKASRFHQEVTPNERRA